MENSNKKPVASNLDVTGYDEKDLPAVQEESEESSWQPHIDIEYNLTADEVKSGLYAFQKKVLYKKNIIYTALFSIVFILYGYDILINGNRTVVAFLGIILCVLVTCFIWLNPRRHREQLAKAMSTVEDNFTMEIYREYIYIQEEHGGFRLMFSDPKVFVIQDEEKFIIGVGKERIYIIPKRCLDSEKLSGITGIFENLGERFTRQ